MSGTSRFFTLDGMADFCERLKSTLGFETTTNKPGRRSLTSKDQLDKLYRNNWLAGAVVDCVADDMAKNGLELSIPNDDKAVEAFQKCEKETGLWDAFTEGTRWGRLYGGAAVVPLINGQNMGTELNVDTVGLGQLRGFKVFTRYELMPSDKRIEILGRDLGLPEQYEIRSTKEQIHHSRIIRFLGAPVPPDERDKEEFWSDSVLEKIREELENSKMTNRGIANLVRFAHLRIFKIKGYREAIGQGGDLEEIMGKHFASLARMQDILGATILDADDEFITNTYSFGGVRDIQQNNNEQVSGASSIPMMRLTGQSPGGLNANGESNERAYYDKVERDTERDFRPALDRVIPLMLKSAAGYIPEEWSYTFRPLQQLNDTQKATVMQTEVAMVRDALDSGMIDKETAIYELRDLGKKYGRFANLTEEAIKRILNNAPLIELAAIAEQTELANGEEEERQPAPGLQSA